jgi:large subunit ribosomal protein L20
MRVKRGKAHLKHRKHILKEAKGYKWGRKSKIKLAKVAILKAGVYAYRDRKRKKREFRRLWQIQINAFCRQFNLSYSKFINKLKTNKIELNRKILAQLINSYPKIAEKILNFVNK